MKYKVGTKVRFTTRCNAKHAETTVVRVSIQTLCDLVSEGGGYIMDHIDERIG